MKEEYRLQEETVVVILGGARKETKTFIMKMVCVRRVLASHTPVAGETIVYSLVSRSQTDPLSDR